MTWQQPNLPDLSQYKIIGIDTEDKDLTPWKGGYVVGVSIATPDGRAFYYPILHPGQSTKNRVIFVDWAKRELRGKEIVMHHARYDLLMLLETVGINLTEHNIIRDTMHMSALIDDNQKGGYSLDNLCHEYFHERKLDLPFNKKDLWMYAPEDVGYYAERDAFLTLKLHEYLYQKIQLLGLEKVYELESAFIPVILEMEHNGLRLDREKLHLWLKETNNELLRLSSRLGPINPNAGIDIKKVFDIRGIPYLYNLYCKDCDYEFIGQPNLSPCHKCSNTQISVRSPSFAEESLKFSKHPISTDILLSRKIMSLRSKYLLPWQTMGKTIRCELHQLRGDEYGTISGRLSASTPKGFSGAHPQQIWKPKKQAAEIGDRWILRELIIPDNGQLFFTSDARQIEYRLFAHYVSHFNPESPIIKSYQTYPGIDYHKVVTDLIFKGEIDRESVKQINFMKIYGGGANKLATMLRCSLNKAKEYFNNYDNNFPEAKELIKAASIRAKQKGEVRTIYGRRGLISPDRAYVALNRIIQGSAADVLKERLIAVYKERKELGVKMRLTVHDELDGDIPDQEQANRVNSILEDFQGPSDFKLAIPLLWDMKVGKNWAMKE